MNVTTKRFTNDPKHNTFRSYQMNRLRYHITKLIPIMRSPSDLSEKNSINISNNFNHSNKTNISNNSNNFDKINQTNEMNCFTDLNINGMNEEIKPFPFTFSNSNNSNDLNNSNNTNISNISNDLNNSKNDIDEFYRLLQKNQNELHLSSYQTNQINNLNNLNQSNDMKQNNEMKESKEIKEINNEINKYSQPKRQATMQIVPYSFNYFDSFNQQLPSTQLMSLENGKMKIRKELKNIGRKENPMTDQIFWKMPENQLIVYVPPKETIYKLLTSSFDDENENEMLMECEEM